jgi:hypothetical protein
VVRQEFHRLNEMYCFYFPLESHWGPDCIPVVLFRRLCWYSSSNNRAINPSLYFEKLQSVHSVSSLTSMAQSAYVSIEKTVWIWFSTNFGVSYRLSLQLLIIIVVKHHTNNAVVSSEDDSVSARIFLFCTHMTSFTFSFFFIYVDRMMRIGIYLKFD